MVYFFWMASLVNRQAALWVISIVLVASFILNTFPTDLLPRRILGPARELSEAGRRVGSADLEVKVQEGREDEFGELARAFHQMTEAIRARAASGHVGRARARRRSRVLNPCPGRSPPGRPAGTRRTPGRWRR
jgi:nitrogen fixation/metabolism regulation signal transduction histidine kinase